MRIELAGVLYPWGSTAKDRSLTCFLKSTLPVAAIHVHQTLILAESYDIESMHTSSQYCIKLQTQTHKNQISCYYPQLYM